MTQSLEDYLETIYVLVSGGKPAQVREVARLLGVKMPSVVKAIHELKKRDLVTQEPYAPIKLTEQGEIVAQHVLSRHKLIHSFLVKLGVSSRTADRDACLMEHILSAETLDRIRIYTEKKTKPEKKGKEK